LPASRTPGGGRVSPGAKRLKISKRCRHRLAGPTSPPSSLVQDPSDLANVAWWNTHCRQAPQVHVPSEAPLPLVSCQAP